MPFANREGVDLLVDVYRPQARSPLPGLVLIHGGGWESGSRADVAMLTRSFAEEGFVVFAADYRLAPADPFPAALVDVGAAVQWVRDHASAFDVDPGRIGAFGVSAGGHLAASLAVHGSGALDTDTRIRAAVSWSGPMDLALTIAEAHGDGRESLERMIGQFVGCPGLGCSDVLWTASPVAHVDGSDGALFIVNSEGEATPLGQAQLMAQRLQEAGVEHRLVEVPGSLHADGFGSELVPGSRETVFTASLAFLRATLGQPAAASSDTEGWWRSQAAALLGVIVVGLAVVAVRSHRRRGRRAASVDAAGSRPAVDGAVLAWIDDLGRQGLSQPEISMRVASRCRLRAQWWRVSSESAAVPHAGTAHTRRYVHFKEVATEAGRRRHGDELDRAGGREDSPRAAGRL